MRHMTKFKYTAHSHTVIAKSIGRHYAPLFNLTNVPYNKAIILQRLVGRPAEVLRKEMVKRAC